MLVDWMNVVCYQVEVQLWRPWHGQLRPIVHSPAANAAGCICAPVPVRSEANPAVVGGVCLAPIEVEWLAALARVVRQLVGEFSWHSILKATVDEPTCVVWCMKVGLLLNASTYPKFDLAMSFALKSKRWRCRRAACADGGSVERGMRFESLFKGSKIPMAKAGADRTKPTLSRLIKKHISPGTNIISDRFGSYVSANESHNLKNNPLLVDHSYGH
ncbi:hypothetical protein H257_05140 [Aphanomyces astaci]|uniref:ISXO2-like transposase domain-containing protein n=1 Tax=Aphanomyces astaci TaxID=112090 RepID=W4GS62_APHAT|nr:hypothetical protein H257_05140 [Aphanomyces astaci]ETV82537.1 hypothetical protein H257_05140 [Aphanomyces astaci]|eukprot:XP_009828206.1 hypothetical protein H257_05140 [Aphanomyces astaci]